METLLLTLLLLLPIVFALPNSCEISIVGAGIGGVYTAWRLTVDTATVPASSVCIFEAKQRSGGRILSVRNPIPGFEGYTVDLGAYRYPRSRHVLIRSLAEDVLDIPFLCYTDPLDRVEDCAGIMLSVLSTRGRVFGIKSNGKDAEDSIASFTPKIPYRIKPKFQWGPGKPLDGPRDPFSLVYSPLSIMKEIADRFDELEGETDYPKAMKIADEIIIAMKNGSYRGIPYSEVSLLQVATAEGYTTEELQFQFDRAFGDNFFMRRSLEQLAGVFVREAALAKNEIGLKGTVTPVEMRDGVPRRAGLNTITEKMVEQLKAKGVRLFFGAKVTGVFRASPGEKRLKLAFADGQVVDTSKLVLNVGKPDLIALGLESEPMKSSDVSFRRSVERIFVAGASKTYCFWEDAWWYNTLGVYIGRIRTGIENLHAMRYHDGHVTCEDRQGLKGCRGGLLVSYNLGDSSGVGMGIHFHGHNEFPYSPLTNTDNPLRLIAGNMTGVQQLYFDDLVAQVRRTHKSSLKAKGLDVRDVIPDPVGCVVADWKDVGIHTNLGPGKGMLNTLELFTRPVEDLDISLVNEAWSQDQGWAESALRSSERTLFHQYGLAKPSWLEEPYHTAMIVKLNQG